MIKKFRILVVLTYVSLTRRHYGTIFRQNWLNFIWRSRLLVDIRTSVNRTSGRGDGSIVRQTP